MANRINRREFLKAMGALAATPLVPAALKQRRRPNILLLLMDDMTYKAIGSLNNAEIHTPNIDRLTRRGTAFTRAFNEGSWSGAVCTPARSMLISGLHLWHAHKAFPQFHGIPLWGETFGKHGYDTFFSGKWHVSETTAKRSAAHIGPHSGRFDRGMFFSSGNQYFRPHTPDQKIDLPDTPWMVARLTEAWRKHPNRRWRADDQALAGHWIKSNDNLDRDWVEKHCPAATHASDIWTEAALEFLNQRTAAGSHPFFMHLAYFSPHDPRQSPRAYLDRYAIDKIAVPPNFLPEFPFNQGDHRCRDEILAPFPRSHFDVQVHRREYYAIISYIDHHIGRILDTLEHTGLDDETIVIFTSDHGLAVGQQGLMGKQNLFDNSTRVPLVMAGPGIPAGQQVDQMIYHSALFPTTCELADLPIPKTVEKQSFADLATGQQRHHARQQSIYGGYKDFQRSIRTEQYKLIEYRVYGKKHAQLFDLQDNPWEIVAKNLYRDPSHQSVVKDLRHRLRDLQKQYDDPMQPV